MSFLYTFNAKNQHSPILNIEFIINTVVENFPIESLIISQ